jgi:hypothetical protein
MADDELRESDLLAGLTDVVSLGLARCAIRTRESRATLSAWRLTISSTESAGTIDLVETGEGNAFYRGAGVFLGWPQAGLASAYRRLRPEGTGPEPDPGQFG